MDFVSAAPSDDRTDHAPLASSLRAAATRFPSKAAIIFGDRTLTYAEFDLEAQRIALRLVAAGVGPGDRVALHMHNGADLALTYFACFYAGAIAVPINTRMKAPEIEFVLTHSGASIYLGQSDLFQEINGLHSRCAGVRQFATDWRDLKACADDAARGELPVLAADRPAAILYTSGTTARPKGVVHTHRTLLAAARLFSVARDDIGIIITLMVHAAGLMMLLSSINAAATAVLIERFEAEAVLDAIERHRGTYVYGMSVMYRALIADQNARPRDVHSGRRYFASGDAVPPALKSEFAQRFGRPLYEVFATTENTLIAINYSATEPYIGSLGWAIPGVDIDVVDDNGKPACIDTVGELIVRSASNLIGYWNDPVATRAAFTENWFHTGDLVRRSSDGYLWFAGRKKEIIVRGGSNISPQEVEAVLYEHAGVREAGVVGIPDPILGHRVVAYVSLRPDQAVAADELIAFVGERLAAYKTPEEIIFVEDVPKSAAGKVLRRALRESAEVTLVPPQR